MEAKVRPGEAVAAEVDPRGGPEGQVPSREAEPERTQFRALILGNPNYFGNLKISPFQPVKQIILDTKYEELKCVGYNPQFDRLEAVVYIKSETGYNGGVCSPGTPEYVRFYLSYDNGVTWEDLGMTSFQAYDIPGDKPLEYDVTLPIHPKEKSCSVENLPRVRAILSWNVPPPPGTPDFTPVWGNVSQARIQIDPLKFVLLGDLLREAKLKLPQNVQAAVDLSQPIQSPKPGPLAAAELKTLYKEKGVPEHRYLFSEIHKLIAKPALAESLMAPSSKKLFAELGINLAEVVGKLLQADGNTRYEELTCVGLNPNLDTLVGVLKVKLPYGYSGNLCSAGSTEYVAFWVDWGDGAGWTYAGTTSVNVHDIRSIPPDGLWYSVFLPVDASGRRRPCEQGPKTVKVRAILSWQVPPPPTNPAYLPVWGNRETTLVHIRPGPVIQAGTHPPLIETVGGMAVPDIDGVTGLASGSAVTAGFTAAESPFGGLVVITGHIANPPDISGGAAALKYRVLVSDDGGATWQRLTNSFPIVRSQLLGGVWSFLPTLTQAVDADDWYTYYEDLTAGPGNPQIFVVGNLLARWQTAGLSGLWQIKVEVKDPANPGPIWSGSVVTVCLDNIAPGTAIDITSGGGPCGDFTIGDVISGTYSVSDEHFGRLNFTVAPALGGTFTSPSPLPRSYPTVPTTGEAGTWSLNTAGMPICGYVVRIHAWDRTIVNSGFVGHYGTAVVGLCLREP